MTVPTEQRRPEEAGRGAGSAPVAEPAAVAAVAVDGSEGVVGAPGKGRVAPGAGLLRPAGSSMAGPRPWSPRATWALRIVGLLAVVSTAVTVWLGLWVTPPSQNMGQLVRLVYVHPPIAWVALYLAFGALGLGSVLWLWPRTRNLAWDRLAAAGAEVGVVFTALTLATGSIWGRPTWGVWWAWDARLTATALLLVLLLGYLALRRVPADPDTRARRSAVAGLVALVDVPIVYFSVSWWHTLHENTQVDIHGLMAATMLLGFVSFTLMFGWMLATALRIQTLRAYLEDLAMDQALAERQAEGALAAVRPMGEPTPAPSGPLSPVPIASGSVASGSVASGSVASGSLLASPVDASWSSTAMAVPCHGSTDGPLGARGGAR